MAEDFVEYEPAPCGDRHSWWWEPSLCPRCYPGPDVPVWDAPTLAPPRQDRAESVRVSLKPRNELAPGRRNLWWDA